MAKGGLIGPDATITRVSSSQTKVTSTTPSFPVPSSYLTATVVVVAGGGGAGMGHAGGGGGGGARISESFDVTPYHGTTPITIGGGGDGAPTPGGPPNGITFTGEKDLTQSHLELLQQVEEKGVTEQLVMVALEEALEVLEMKVDLVHLKELTEALILKLGEKVAAVAVALLVNKELLQVEQIALVVEQTVKQAQVVLELILDLIFQD